MEKNCFFDPNPLLSDHYQPHLTLCSLYRCKAGRQEPFYVQLCNLIFVPDGRSSESVTLTASAILASWFLSAFRAQNTQGTIKCRLKCSPHKRATFRQLVLISIHWGQRAGWRELCAICQKIRFGKNATLNLLLWNTICFTLRSKNRKGANEFREPRMQNKQLR